MFDEGKNQKEIVAGIDLTRIVDSLFKKSIVRKSIWKKRSIQIPSKEIIIEIMEELRKILFLGYFRNTEKNIKDMRFYIEFSIGNIFKKLQEQIKNALCFVCDFEEKDCPICNQKSFNITKEFLEKLPAIQQLLEKDAISAYENDPAAKSLDEVILCYPGLFAITNYRIAHELYIRDVPVIPRIITEHAHSITGIDIHPGATIGESFFIDHGTGVVIGETCIIGNRVRIYQGVTLGAKSFPLDKEGKPIKGLPRHPIIEDDVIIYAGATILGRVRIGRGSIIGGNVWLTKSIPPFSRVTQSDFKQEEIFYEGSGI